MNLPSWPDVTNARGTEEKRKGKSKIEKPHSDVDAHDTETYEETTDCVAFWDTEIPEMNWCRLHSSKIRGYPWILSGIGN